MNRTIQLLLLVASAILSAVVVADVAVCSERKPAKISPGRLSQYITSDQFAVIHGDLSVAADTVIERDLAILEGSLDLASGSRLNGDAWIVNGNLILGGHAQVNGTIHIVNGDIFQSREATVNGQIRRYTCLCELDREQFRADQQVVFVKVAGTDNLPLELSAGSGPSNKVDFGSVFLGVKRGDMEGPQTHWRGRANLIAPFRDNTRGYLGVDFELLVPLKGKRADLHIRGFKNTATNDDWQYPLAENSWAQSVTHNDFFDYYERSGGYIGAVVRPARSWSIDGGVYIDHSRSLLTRSAPALFNNDRPLRDNPAINRGEIAGGVAGVQYDTRVFAARPANAWFARIEVDGGADIGPGDFKYSTLTLDVRRYNRLLRGLNLDLRGRVFTTRDNLPRQRWQSLNGYGGVRGLRDIPFDDPRGDRLALFSAELRVGMPQIPILEILYTRWNIVTFADIGILRQHGDQFGAWEFLEADWDEWGKSAGIGISGESFLPYLGFYVAQDLDRKNKRPRFIVRFARSF